MTRRAINLGIWTVAIAVLAAGSFVLYRWPARYLRLADGAEIFFHSDSKVTPAAQYPNPRAVGVDGDFFFRVPAAAQPMIVRSRLLILTVTGKSAFRITAYAKEAGEQVEVLYGNVKANKSYKSPYPEPDLLTAGQMTMINRNIDLMEKEKTDLPALQAWSDALVDSAAKRATPNR